LRRFDPARPVFVESESKKIGALRVPEGLIERMRASPCLRLDVPRAARIALLIDEYAHYLADPAALQAQLARLLQLRGRETLNAWDALIAARDWPSLVGELLDTHYDPSYFRSLDRNYAASERDLHYTTADCSATGFAELAMRITSDTMVSARPVTVDPTH
jgi:tRNA 2-selenouridine synthase